MNWNDEMFDYGTRIGNNHFISGIDCTVKLLVFMITVPLSKRYIFYDNAFLALFYYIFKLLYDKCTYLNINIKN